MWKPKLVQGVDIFYMAHTPARVLLISGLRIEGTWGTKCLARILLFFPYVETAGTPRRRTKLQTGPDSAIARVDHFGD